jgi:branched-chain amino acid transport system ATP-binding protein
MKGDMILKVDSIRCGYDGVPVIHGLSLEVREGEIVAIIGGNGAGKSTTMRTVAGLMHPSSGSISFKGEDITAMPAYSIVARGLSYVPEGRRLFSKLSVRQNLEMGAYTTKDRGEIDARMQRSFQLFPKLAERANQTAETMSGGEQQMCAIARGLMSDPRLIMLDELSLGLQPSLVERVLETVVEIRKQGITVVLVEQLVQEALEIADRGYVIQTGTIFHEGSARELLASPEVRTAYMGM